MEDALGHGRFLSSISCAASRDARSGLLAPDSTIPNLGASGAIAGVLGAYFVLYPRARIVTMVPLFVLFPLVEIPAGLYLLGWFLLQFWMGSSQLSASRASAGGGAGVLGARRGLRRGHRLGSPFRARRAPAARYRIS